MARGRYRGQRLTTPTLWLHGTGDQVIGRHMVEALRPHADDLQIEWVEGCGHFIAEERPDLVADRVRAFFAAG
jgi:pimeloyl-ACP methyl ester carboxylesterase